MTEPQSKSTLLFLTDLDVTKKSCQHSCTFNIAEIWNSSTGQNSYVPSLNHRTRIHHSMPRNWLPKHFGIKMCMKINFWTRALSKDSTSPPVKALKVIGHHVNRLVYMVEHLMKRHFLSCNVVNRDKSQFGAKFQSRQDDLQSRRQPVNALSSPKPISIEQEPAVD